MFDIWRWLPPCVCITGESWLSSGKCTSQFLYFPRMLSADSQFSSVCITNESHLPSYPSLGSHHSPVMPQQGVTTPQLWLTRESQLPSYASSGSHNSLVMPHQGVTTPQLCLTQESQLPSYVSPGSHISLVLPNQGVTIPRWGQNQGVSFQFKYLWKN